MTITPEDAVEPIDLFSPEVVADPFGWYARLREAPTLLKGTMMGGPPMWLATRYDDVYQVLTDRRFLTNPPAEAAGDPDIREGVFKRLDFPPDLIEYMANILNASDGVDHARLRRLVSSSLTARRVSNLRPRVEEITESLLDQLAEAGRDGTPVDLVEAFCYPLPVTVICELVGIDEPERPHWRAWGDAMATMDAEHLPDTLRTCIRLAQEVLDARRAEPRDEIGRAHV